jgi:hypothetical protein
MNLKHLSLKQASLADRLGRTLARTKMAAPVPVDVIARAASRYRAGSRAIKKPAVKAMQLLRGRPLTKLFQDYKGEKGVGAAIARFKADPGRTLFQAAKGAVVPGALLYGGTRLLAGSEQ